MKPYAVTDAINSAGSELMSCVSSRAKIAPVNGERIVPPSTAAMHTSGHSVASPPGRIGDSSAPTAPPMMSNGASTPPDVPEPSDADQMNALTSTSHNSAVKT